MISIELSPDDVGFKRITCDGFRFDVHDRQDGVPGEAALDAIVAWLEADAEADALRSRIVRRDGAVSPADYRAAWTHASMLSHIALVHGWEISSPQRNRVPRAWYVGIARRREAFEVVQGFPEVTAHLLASLAAVLRRFEEG